MAIGIDIGGSGVRAARVAEGATNGPVLTRTLSDRSVASVLSAVSGVVRELGGGAQVGVGVPGFIQQGVVRASPNFPTWVDVDLRKALEAKLGMEVRVANDANAAALGAWSCHGRRGDLVLLTLGTGVGGGVVTGGRLLTGAGGTGAELGHIFAGGDRPCGCGGRGCLETWCSTSGMVARARDAGHSYADGREIIQDARAGDAFAIQLVHEAGLALGRGLVTLVNLFNPDRVLVTGGLAQAADLLAPPAERFLREYGIGPSVCRVSVQFEGRADEFAIIGAASLFSN